MLNIKELAIKYLSKCGELPQDMYDNQHMFIKHMKLNNQKHPNIINYININWRDWCFDMWLCNNESKTKILVN